MAAEASDSSAAAATAGASSDSPQSTKPIAANGWPLYPEPYTQMEQIGQGAFARVVRSHCTANGEDCAIKIISLERVNTSMQDIQGEVRGMKLARHANVLELLCSFVVDADLWLVMPLMDKGSCYYIMRSLRSRGVTREGEGIAESFIRVILREVLQGLEYLHSNGQLHRDIKAGNILVNSEGQVKLGDFGVAGWLHEFTAARSGGKANTFVGTPCWMAPEVMEQTKGYTTQVDIWSLGITALELAKGVAPYSHLSPMQVLVKTLREPAPSLDSYEQPAGSAQPKFSAAFSSFVAKCLEKNPEKRPSAAALLKEKFIKNAPKAEDLVSDLLPNVPSVGSASAEVTADRPAVYDQVVVAEESQYAAGTTWRFPGDEQEKVSAEEVTAAVQGLQALTQGSGELDHSDDEDDDEDDE